MKQMISKITKEKRYPTTILLLILVGIFLIILNLNLSILYPMTMLLDAWATPPHEGMVNKLLCDTHYTFEFGFPVSNVSITSN